jgi:purine-binding chemotaxis protein CheW
MKPSRTRVAAARAAVVDWDDVHRRLERGRMAIEQGWSPGPAMARKILTARAQALAREPEAAQELRDSITVIEFVLASESYAFESRFVAEIHALKELTALPCTPAFIRGIVNVRGRVMSVVDLKRFFDLPATGLTDLDKLIILRSDAMEFGVLADAIVGARVIPLGNVQQSLPTLTGIREQYLRGVTADRTVILDAGRLLADNGLVVHEVVEI